MTRPAQSPWRGVLTSIQPRIRLTRSSDQRSRACQRFVLRVGARMRTRHEMLRSRSTRPSAPSTVSRPAAARPFSAPSRTPAAAGGHSGIGSQRAAQSVAVPTQEPGSVRLPEWSGNTAAQSSGAKVQAARQSAVSPSTGVRHA